MGKKYMLFDSSCEPLCINSDLFISKQNEDVYGFGFNTLEELKQAVLNVFDRYDEAEDNG